MVLGVVFKMNIIKPLLSSIMLSSLICLIFFEVLQKQLEELNTMSDTK